ncbi:hypothetical protein BH20VER3_BH20VER3_22690 [soil metagenome]
MPLLSELCLFFSLSYRHVAPTALSATDQAKHIHREAATGDYSAPQIMATEVVRLPPMLKVRNFFAPPIWRSPAWLVSC